MSKIITDANSAVAQIAYKLSEVIPIYPITPSTPMAEYCSLKSNNNEKNLFNENVKTIQMQSEAGVSGTLHGALLGGALSSTFTCSQGLLLMMPNMFKIAGESLPATIHVSARALSSHALSIFGDHSDVMAVRSTGFAMICSASVQEAHDMALLSHVCSAKYNIPVLHFFDGFRTSHEFQKIEELSDSVLKKMFPKLSEIYIKKNPLSPNNPLMFGTAQNPDVFFQGKEVNNAKYASFSKNFCDELEKFNTLVQREYKPFEYFGAKNAKNVIISMGSSTQTIKETISLNKTNTALISVRLYRPFDENYLLSLLPKSTKRICVLDRTKENGARGPLFLDVVSAILKSKRNIKVIGGRYGLGGKEFSPSCVFAVIENLNSKKPKDDFSVGILDDINHSSLPLTEAFNKTNQNEIKIFGLGSDGSVSASKSLIKILGKSNSQHIQGFFEYDSKKAGSMTVSHIRLSDQPILSSYLVHSPNIISINNFSFVHRYNCLEGLKQNGIVLINSVFSSNEIDKVLPNSYKAKLKETNSKLFVVNAQKIAKECGLKEKINTVMEASLLKVSEFLNLRIAKQKLANQIQQIFSLKGEEIVSKNSKAMERGFEEVEEVNIKNLTVSQEINDIKSDKEKGFQKVINSVKTLQGNSLPVSCFSFNGSMPTDTSKFEKRGIASTLPHWIAQNCLQCGQCVLACPHGALKAVLIEDKDCPNDENMQFSNAIGLKNHKYRIQISPEDCTGCGVCFNTCPALKKAIEMVDAEKELEQQKENYQKTLSLPCKKAFSTSFPKGLQFEKSYFNFSGACAGCGQTPYIKLVSSLFGENMIIANATGCSSIYSGSFPSCPFSKNSEGKGPAWASSLFEDNAEFGLGIKIAGEFSKNKDNSVWIIGGDGWAYDIGFGGLDHVLQSNANVNILVLDNEVYSNTGGQSSKSTPTGAVANFAENGKTARKKNLGMIALSYKNAYVAQVALGADMSQCIKAFKEANEFQGPSIIIAYSPCVEHGFDMSETMSEMKKAVESGYWNLFRYNPKTGLKIDFEPSVNTKNFLKGERRFTCLMKKDSSLAKELFSLNTTQNQENLTLLKMFENKNKNKNEN